MDKLRRGSAAEAAAFDEVMNVLVRERLLVVHQEGEGPSPNGGLPGLLPAQASAAEDAGSGAPILEVAHEQLIRSWKALHAWIIEDRQMLVDLRQFDQWVEEAKDFSAYVLDRDRLGHARELLKNYPDDIDRTARELIARSERAVTRKRRWVIRIGIGAIVVAGVMTVLAFWALGQRDKARQQQDEAQTQRDAARRQAALVRDAALVISARDLLARNQPALAAGVLLEVSDPSWTHGWAEVAQNVLKRSFPKITLRVRDQQYDGRRQRDLNIYRSAFSPDGKWIVAAVDDSTVRTWNADGSGDPIELSGHRGLVSNIAFSSEGKRVVAAFKDGTVCVWNTDGSGGAVVLKGHEMAIVSVVFSPDGKRIVTASVDKTVRVWNADGSGDPTTLRGHEEPVIHAIFSPDGTRILTISKNGTARVWNADGSGTEIIHRSKNYPVAAAAISPDGRRILIAFKNGLVCMWNMDTFGPPIVLGDHKAKLDAVAFSPDGHHFVTATAGKPALVWHVDRVGTPVVFTDDTFTEATFSPDGKRIATWTSSSTRVWNADGSGVLLEHEFEEEGDADGPHSISFSPDSKYIAIGSKVWDLEASDNIIFGRQTYTFSSDGKRFLTSCPFARAAVVKADGFWDHAALRTLPWYSSGAAFSPDGKRIAIASGGKTAHVWNADGTGSPIILKGHKAGIRSIAFSSDGASVVTASYDNTVRVWNAYGATTTAEVLHDGAARFAALSPDGKRIVTSSMSGEMRIWNNTDGVWRAGGAGRIGFSAYLDCRRIAAFSPDGRRIVTACEGKLARVWDADTWKDPIVLRGHDDLVTFAAFSPDGKQIVTASKDKTARVWNADGSGHPIVLRGHEDMVTAASFTPDGRNVLTASDDKTVRIWQVPIDGIEGLKRRLMHATSDCLPPDVRRAYLGETKAIARAQYKTCERVHGRTPFYPEEPP